MASGRNHLGTINVHQAGAVMYVARLDAGSTVEVPDAPFVHLFVAAGTASLGSDPLGQGDAVRFTNTGTQALTADTATEIIIWESDASASR